MATITDIARELDISPGTVSRALNNSRLVSPALASRIGETANRIGYAKRSIRKHRGRAILSIKLVLPRHAEPERALFYDLVALTEGIRSGFRHCGINLLCETASPKFKAFPHKKGGDTNGFIFAFNQPSPATLRDLREVGTPFVVLNRSIPGIPCVASDNAKGMDDLAIHLLERNPSVKPAFISLEGLGQIGDERLAGFALSCTALGIPFDPGTDAHSFGSTSEISTKAIRNIAENHNVLVCANDIIGTVVLAELSRLGIPIPARMAVTGFDDSPVRRLSRPLLTTVGIPLAKLAATAAARLESQIIDYETPEEITRIAGKLLIGETT
jgi:DNA-binding LacI/PurR family transcriptional regulator